MLLYDFKCLGLDCQNEEELFINKDDKPNCSKCGRVLERQPCTPAINTRGCSGASNPFTH